ncbi:DnaD domain protein, partial [Enterococcus avium]|nr:DnaD domain protein [Enterococcus avium]
NKTKASETSITKNSEDSAVRYWLNQVNPAEAPFITQSIQHWVNDFGGQDEIIILAIDDMLKHGARSYKYLDAVLRSWENKQLDTVEKVKRQLESHYAKPSNKTKSRNSFKQVTNYGETLYTYYEQELRFSPNMTFDEYVAKKRLNERDRQALEQYVHSLGE